MTTTTETKDDTLEQLDWLPALNRFLASDPKFGPGRQYISGATVHPKPLDNNVPLDGVERNGWFFRFKKISRGISLHLYPLN